MKNYKYYRTVQQQILQNSSTTNTTEQFSNRIWVETEAQIWITAHSPDLVQALQKKKVAGLS
jgi:hypothetical protein